MLDTQPPEKVEHQAWNMRPRSKEREIGPEFRFKGNKTQIERLSNQIDSNLPSANFNESQMINNQTRKLLRKYYETGKMGEKHRNLNIIPHNVVS